MPFRDGAAYDPETLDLLRRVLDDAWASLSTQEQSQVLKTDLATRVLEAAADGERDPARLKAHALARLASPALHH